MPRSKRTGAGDVNKLIVAFVFSQNRQFKVELAIGPLLASVAPMANPNMATYEEASLPSRLSLVDEGNGEEEAVSGAAAEDLEQVGLCRSSTCSDVPQRVTTCCRWVPAGHRQAAVVHVAASQSRASEM